MDSEITADVSERSSAYPLDGVRVLDLTDEVGVLAGKVLAGLGASVVRPELPDGDDVRRRPRLWKGESDATPISLAHLAHNIGKQSYVLDWRTPEGRNTLRGLIRGSDITICSRPRVIIEQAGIDIDSFASQFPATTLVLLKPFPDGSPFDGAPFSDITISAASGFAWLCGTEDGPPEHPKGQIAYAYGGISAAIAGLVGLTARHLRGVAGRYELTAQEALAFATAQSGDPNPYKWYGTVPSRREWSATALRALQQCGDGKWVTFVMLGARFDGLARWLADAGVSEEFLSPEWSDHDYYNANLERLTAAIRELCRRYPSEEIVSTGQALSLMVMPVTTVDDLLVDPQLSSRNVFESVRGSQPEFCVPRVPMVFSESNLPSPRRAPEHGEHDEHLVKQWLEDPKSSRPAAATGGSELPLRGLRVADFSWMLAAPLASRFLSDLGADVIRIESVMRRDMTREIGPQPPGYQSLDTNSTQHQAGSNKRSIALDLKQPRAREVVRRIFASSDIVLDNYRPGTMEKWGFNAENLLREWPELIVASMPAVGSTGPHKHFGAIGNGVAGYGGLNGITGFAANPPMGVGPIIADFFAPLFTVQAILAAHHVRQTTGRGQHIDCSMLESTLWLLDTAFAEYQLLGNVPARSGNRSEGMSPHGIFPCQGDDEWIAIAVSSDEQWRTLCRIAGVSSGDRDRMVRHEQREAHEDELERIVSDATKRRSKWQLACELQRAGVAAAPVENVRDHLENDSGMTWRFSEIAHPYGMSFLVQNQFIRPEGSTVPNRRAPMIGEHSDEVLRDIGFSPDEITQMFAEGILN